MAKYTLLRDAPTLLKPHAARPHIIDSILYIHSYVYVGVYLNMRGHGKRERIAGHTRRVCAAAAAATTALHDGLFITAPAATALLTTTSACRGFSHIVAREH